MADGDLYFSAFAAETGRELYRLSAGSTTPVLVADINPGVNDSFPGDFAAFNGDLYFVAFAQETGQEVYRLSPGSTAPTLIDINAGAGSSQFSIFPAGFIGFNGELYFTAITEENGKELYHLAPGSAVPTLIDINPGPESAFGNFPVVSFTEVMGDLYFTAFTEETGYELYRLSPGSSTPTLIEIDPGAIGSQPSQFTEFNGDVYFAAFGGETGTELYRLSPGSSTPTLIEIQPGAGGSSPSEFIEFNGELYFTAFTDQSGNELYHLAPGSNTPTLIDLNPGAEGSFPLGSAGFIEFGGDLYFSAFQEETGQELYRLSPGSTTPTLIEINPGEGGAFPDGITAFKATEFDGALYFNAYTQETGLELFKLSPGSDTPTLIDINPGREGSSAQEFTVLNGELYFNAVTEEAGQELYRLAPGDTTPTLIDIIPGPESSSPVRLFALPEVSSGPIFGTPGNDTLSGGAPDTRYYGLGGNDTLLGGTGNNRLDGGTGADTMSGGLGDDLYIVDDAGDRVIEAPNEGIDTISSSVTVSISGVGANSLSDNVENITLTGTAAIDATGNARANSIRGNDAANRLDGGAGDDALTGLGGDDLILGGDGRDVILAGEGNDTVQAGRGDDWMSGGDGNDVLAGGDGRDYLIGGAGRDLLQGGAGADVFRFEAASDSAVGAATRDFLVDFAQGTDRIDLRAVDANATTPGDQAFTFIGNARFSGAAGELRYDYRLAGSPAQPVSTLIQGDIDGDGIVDFEIEAAALITPTPADFWL